MTLWSFIKGILIQEESDRTKQMSVEVDSTATSNTRTTLKSAQSADRTLNLPDADDTLVGKATTDVLTNKTFDADGTGNVLSNVEDANIKAGAAIDVSKLSSGVVSNTEFDYLNNVASQVVGESDTNTLTNKTIDVDNNTVSNIENDNIKAGAAIDASKIGNGDVDNTELSYLNGLSSDIQTQLDAKIDDYSAGADNAVLKSNAAGDAVERSGVIVDDSNNVSGINDLTVTGNLQVNGTTTTLNTATLDVEDSNITVNKNGDQSSANTLVSGITVEMSDATDARLGYDSSLASKFKVGEVGSEVEVADVSSTQDLSNKTFIDAITLEELSSTPTTPASGDKKFYAKNDGKVYTLDDAGNEVEVGSGASGGVKNYIADTNSDFEQGIGDWAAYDDSTDYVDGTGGASGNLVLSATSTASEVLEGSQSLKVAKSAASVQYEGVSVLSSTIDRIDRGKVVFATISVDMSSVTTSGDWEVRAYDVTNSEILYTGVQEGREIPNSKGKVVVPVYTQDTTEEIRLSLHCTSTDATAYDFFVDEVKLAPSNGIVSNKITEWESFNPTGTWTTNTSYSGVFRRVGDTLECSVTVSLSGAPNATNLFVDLPSGLTIDTSKLDTVNSENPIGIVRLLDSGTSSYNGFVRYDGGTSVLPTVIATSGSFAETGLINNTTPFTFASGDLVILDFQVPIEEWSDSANIVNEHEAAVRTTKVRYGTSASTANSSIAVGAEEILDFDQVDYDEYNNVTTGASWKFTASVKAKHRISVQTYYTAEPWTINGYVLLRVYKNGVADSYVNVDHYQGATASSTIRYIQGTVTIEMEPGDYFDIRTSHSEGAARPVATDPNASFIEIEALPDFSLYGVVKNQEYNEYSSGAAGYGGTVGQWYDLTSFTLTPGTYDMELINTGTFGTSTTEVYSAFGIVSGNNAPFDDVAGIDYVLTTRTASAAWYNLVFAKKNYTVTENTTVYVKSLVAGDVTGSTMGYKAMIRRIK